MTLNIPAEYEARLRAAATAAGYENVEQFVIEQVLNFGGPQAPDAKRTGGQWKDQVTIADDFDELPKDFREAFGIVEADGTTD